MPVRPFGSGYDPNSGWPPDDSTGIPWDNNVDLSGQFGPGGFAPNPKLTGPATGPPPGVSLSGPGGTTGNSLTARPAVPNPYGAGMPRGTGAQFYGPQSQNLRPGMSPAVRTGPGPSTDATFAPGEPIPGAADAPWWARLGRGGALGVASSILNPTPTANDAAPTNMWNQRPSGVGPMPVTMPARPVTPTPTPTVTNRPQDRPSYAGPTVAAPAIPPVRPAGPAAARQQPNLGAYDGTIARPNMDVIRGGRNNPGQQTQMGIADWSKLFQRPQQ